MIYAGARGETEAQMGRVLHFGKDQQQLQAALGKLQRQLVEADPFPSADNTAVEGRARSEQNHDGVIGTGVRLCLFHLDSQCMSSGKHRDRRECPLPKDIPSHSKIPRIFRQKVTDGDFV